MYNRNYVFGNNEKVKHTCVYCLRCFVYSKNLDNHLRNIHFISLNNIWEVIIKGGHT